jgi:glycosyltransferase involved in cell wall biosynthesis
VNSPAEPRGADLEELSNGLDQLSSEIELSIVIPCLNEADTLAECVEKAQRTINENRIAAEVIVADNGSTDGSQDIATRLGARIVHVPERGYGSALMGGIAAARGRFILMGDADGSYDFEEIPRFLAKLREGYDLVQGCRLPSGGGKVMPGAMPVLHRWFGNPVFSMLAQRWFHSPIQDIYCGMRGFRKSHYERLDQRCTGMEFATEMIIKSSLLGCKAAQVPITLHPDGRKVHAPHLKTFRDGWRTLRFFLLCTPRRLFLVPGVILIFLGILAWVLALPGLSLHGARFDAHTLLFGSLAMLCGYESVFFAIFAKTLAIKEGLLPSDIRLERFFNTINLEVGLAIAASAMIVGSVLLGLAIEQWRLVNYGSLDYAHTMRLVVPGATMVALGFQTILSAFMISFLGLEHR